MDMSMSKLQAGKPGMLQSMGSHRIERDLVTEQQLYMVKKKKKKKDIYLNK